MAECSDRAVAIPRRALASYRNAHGPSWAAEIPHNANRWSRPARPRAPHAAGYHAGRADPGLRVSAPLCDLVRQGAALRSAAKCRGPADRSCRELILGRSGEPIDSCQGVRCLLANGIERIVMHEQVSPAGLHQCACSFARGAIGVMQARGQIARRYARLREQWRYRRSAAQSKPMRGSPRDP